jgi:hypothetical protein
MENKTKLRNIIRDIIKESYSFRPTQEPVKKQLEDKIDEERIINPDANIYVKQRKNFIGSHIFGEDIGRLGKMYVTYSYGEQFPVYLYINKKWYVNQDDYYLENGDINKATRKHKANMNPGGDVISISSSQMKNMIKNFKKENGISEASHRSVEPGEKN